MPFVDPADMLAGEPLPGWSGRFFHSGNMTFAHYEITEDAQPLHEHHHEQEEVWHIVEGQVAITIDGAEATLEAGSVAIVPPAWLQRARVEEGRNAGPSSLWSSG